VENEYVVNISNTNTNLIIRVNIMDYDDPPGQTIVDNLDSLRVAMEGMDLN
jgi:hypothetical protein